MTRVSLIAAVASNGVIGRGNRLPWKLPADLRHFRSLTLGKPVIMGRKTFESLGRPLAERRNIVVTRQPSRLAGCVVAHSCGEALRLAAAAPEVMVIGGADLYAQFLPAAERMYLTLVHQQFAGDARFPDYASTEWREVAREDRAADEQNPHDFSFVTLERIATPGSSLERPPDPIGGRE